MYVRRTKVEHGGHAKHRVVRAQLTAVCPKYFPSTHRYTFLLTGRGAGSKI